MTASSGVQGVADWLCTFALHSTLVLGIALLLGAALRRRAIGFQEGALRLSLWAALVSSSVQYFALGSPWPFFELPPADVLPAGGGLFAGEPAAAPVPPVTAAATAQAAAGVAFTLILINLILTFFLPEQSTTSSSDHE